MAAVLISCTKKEDPPPEYMSVALPNASLQNDLYYSVNEHARYVELEFSLPLDTASVQGNISFSDNEANYDTAVSVIALDRKAVIFFHPTFFLRNGWQYHINLGLALRSQSGVTLPPGTVVEIRTPGFSLYDTMPQRTAILCISDIHMGEERAITNHYGWFRKNDTALVSLLNLAISGGQVKEVAILGDLFDGWVIPYRFPPFDSAAGVTNIREYFLSVANAPVNVPVIQVMRAIAARSDMRLIYVQGNHDMLLTPSILQEIIPGIVWQGTTTGVGDYSPVGEIIMEHGHRYDLFNCPQPLVNAGHMLPPGFFISRMQAECLRTHPVMIPAQSASLKGSPLFAAAWDLALIYLENKYNVKLNEDSAFIRMSGIDGYTSYFSYNSAKAMYTANIENNWNATQAANKVPYNLLVVLGLIDGQDDLFTAAGYEYFYNTAPKKYKIAVFGHTHNPEIKIFPWGRNYTSIYANTGSWVDPEQCDKKVRTFVMLWPGEWGGSSLDVVSLYQYNRSNSGGGGYAPELIAEQSILR